MQVTGDALAVLETRELPDPSVEAGVLDRDTGGRGQTHGQLLVDLGELAAPDLLGEVEVAEHLVAHPDGDAEEACACAGDRAGTRSCPGAS